MYEQFIQLGSHALDFLLNIPPAWYGLLIGSAGVSLITLGVNKIVKIYTEITSSKFFAGVFLVVSIVSSFIDYVVTNGNFDAGTYGKNTALLIGGATALFHGIRIVKEIASQVKYYAPLVGTKAQSVKAIVEAQPLNEIVPPAPQPEATSVTGTTTVASATIATVSTDKPTGSF